MPINKDGIKVFCNHIDECDTCQCDPLGTCDIKYSDVKEIHYMNNFPCTMCGCKYHTIDEYDYINCTNCGFKER